MKDVSLIKLIMMVTGIGFIIIIALSSLTNHSNQETKITGGAVFKGQFGCIGTPNSSICLIYGGLTGANNFTVNVYTTSGIAVINFSMVETEIVLYEEDNGFPRIPVLFELVDADDNFLSLTFIKYIDDIPDYLGEKWRDQDSKNEEDADKMFPPKDGWIFDERSPKGYNEMGWQSM
jgi:hypothetical protein